MKIIPVFCLFLIPAVMITGPGRALEPQVATLARSGDPVVRVTPAQAQRFGDALGAMARQARVTFVAEAEPFKTTLTKQQAAEILPSGSLAQMVSQVANAYDYTATRRDRVFRLTKRYTNPDDLPCVTLEEAKLTADDLLRHLDMVSPRFRAGMVENDKPFADFLASLSQSQLAMMKEETLPVASLSLQQQFQVRRLANFFYVQLFAEGPTTESLRRLNNALKPDATLCWQTVVKQRAFGLAHLFSADRRAGVLHLRYALHPVRLGSPC